MPKTMHGKPVNEKAWARAKKIVEKEYPKLQGKGDRFYALVTTIYKSVMKSPEYASEAVSGYGGGMSQVTARLSAFLDTETEPEETHWLDGLDEEVALGKDLLFNYMSRQELADFNRALPKESRGDLRKIMEKLIDELTPRNKRVGTALRRLANAVRRGPDPETIGDELYKIADEIGVRLR